MNVEDVRSLIAEHLGVGIGEVRDNSRFLNDLGADSLDMVELAMRFEEALDISIGEDESESCETVADAFTLLQRKTAARKAAWPETATSSPAGQ